MSIQITKLLVNVLIYCIVKSHTNSTDSGNKYRRTYVCIVTFHQLANFRMRLRKLFPDENGEIERVHNGPHLLYFHSCTLNFCQHML